ncbi:MAG: GFA family protein [Candidatus Mycalebacterium zealandia]|nr:MAG: GFA family protein [Candidatus Mycalebacterium zealandia]
MSNAMKAEGKCLCGTVVFKTKEASPLVGVCHCEMCRRWGGGPFMGINCGSDVSFEGGENIEVFNSSDWAERGFCGKCGTHLFYRIKRNKMHMMPVGLFGDKLPLKFTHEVFIDEKPGFYDFSNETEQMTGEECFAKFGEDG